MREFLESKGEHMSNGCWSFLDNGFPLINHLQYQKRSKVWWLASKRGCTLVTTEQFKKLWE